MESFSVPGAHTSNPSDIVTADSDNGTIVHTNSTILIRASVFSGVLKNKWLQALKQVFPLYFAVHLAVLLLSYLSIFFNNPDGYSTNPPLNTLWQSWNHWDTGWYLAIASNGYTTIWNTAFFPLYSLLIRGVMLFIHSPLIAGLLVSNLANLIMLVVLYQLISEDFDNERAQRTVLYLSLFPTAFFFLAAYNESLFLCLGFLCFYQMRRGQWWLAGLFGFFASLTRSTGLLLLLPFCYEYLRQHDFQLKKLRFDILSVAFVPAGIALFGAYCYMRFGDLLAFSHVESHWYHYLAAPWIGIIVNIQAIGTVPDKLSFFPLRSFIDLVPDFLFLGLLILSIAGPWRFRRSHWAYVIYGTTFYIFFHLFPIDSPYSLQSMSRYVLELFPAFIVLASLGKYRIIHLSYLLVAGAGFFALCTLFLMGHWII